MRIYQKGSEWSLVRQAKELVGQRRNELDSAGRAVAENVIRGWRQLDSSRSSVTSFEAEVRANEVALNGVRQEALVGSRTTLDVLNAEQELLNSQVSLVQARHDVQVAYYGVLAGIGRLTARTLALPVEYYDEERYYNEVGSRWIGWGAGDSGKAPVPAPATWTRRRELCLRPSQPGRPGQRAAARRPRPGTGHERQRQDRRGSGQGDAAADAEGVARPQPAADGRALCRTRDPPADPPLTPRRQPHLHAPAPPPRRFSL